MFKKYLFFSFEGFILLKIKFSFKFCFPEFSSSLSSRSPGPCYMFQPPPPGTAPRLGVRLSRHDQQTKFRNGSRRSRTPWLLPAETRCFLDSTGPKDCLEWMLD